MIFYKIQLRTFKCQKILLVIVLTEYLSVALDKQHLRKIFNEWLCNRIGFWCFSSKLAFEKLKFLLIFFLSRWDFS